MRIKIYRYVSSHYQNVMATTLDMRSTPEYVLVKEIEIDPGEIPEVDTAAVLKQQKAAKAAELREALAKLGACDE